MIRRVRHATADELASLTVGALRPRRAARIEAHCAGCDHCTQVRRQLESMPTILASAHYPPMPESETARIESALAVEARQRLAAEPATEAGRRDLPAGHRRRAAGLSWHLPGMSVPASRLVAAAGALAIVAGGGYAIASQALTGQSSAPSRPAAAPAVQPMSLGPEITYGGTTAEHTIHAVQSGTNFVPASLGSQAVAAVHEARATGAAAAPSSGPRATSGAHGTVSAGSAAGGAAGRLSGCLNLIAGTRRVLLVDLAKFEHRPATLIVVAATGTSPAEAWIVGSSCSATDSDILAHAVLRHL